MILLIIDVYKGMLVLPQKEIIGNEDAERGGFKGTSYFTPNTPIQNLLYANFMYPFSLL